MLEILAILVIIAGVVLLTYGLIIREKDPIIAGLIIGLIPLVVYVSWKADIYITAWKIQQIKGLL
jgi:hypothetical protein